ncbi:hypothetical protein FIBSPDRAFT_193476 [Athelia psychrophila]|uniref:Uncharacterized protein n=1 Tax=Athelia psychrophila TaxID=1759441 RepID=A0A166SI57_9AGAM|nr:hypothetical protein FIBSPDRAFT_193476 [Fibularhizoctonia sp. CBS 109695]
MRAQLAFSLSMSLTLNYGAFRKRLSLASGPHRVSAAAINLMHIFYHIALLVRLWYVIFRVCGCPSATQGKCSWLPRGSESSSIDSSEREP